MTSISSTLEPTIWSCDTGQRSPCFDNCQFPINGSPILLQRKGKYIFLLKQSANSYPVQIRAYGQAYRRSCDNQNFSASWVFTFDFIVLMNQSQGIRIVISTSSNFSLTQGVAKPDTQNSLSWHPHQGCLPFTGPYSGWKLIPCERRKC